MSKFKQTEDKYKRIYLGFGSGTMYSYGCYLVSLVNGLNDKGFNFTPEGLNDFLKQNKAFTGEFNNYVNVEQLDDILPNIFISYESVEPYNDKPVLKDLLSPNRIILGKVSAAPIGGKVDDSHFVLVTGLDGKTAIIHDPWTGAEEKITTRWSKYGNIKGLRIFNIKPFVAPQEPNSMEKDAFEYLRDAFESLEPSDELKRGNLEGYVRAITKEHELFAEKDAKSKILDGFISKWQDILQIKKDAEIKTHSEILQLIEEEIKQLMKKEDVLDLYRSEAEKLILKFTPKEILETMKDDVTKLSEIKTINARITDLLQESQSCAEKLDIANAKLKEKQSKNGIVFETKIKGYIIKVINGKKS